MGMVYKGQRTCKRGAVMMEAVMTGFKMMMR